MTFIVINKSNIVKTDVFLT